MRSLYIHFLKVEDQNSPEICNEKVDIIGGLWNKKI